MTAVSQTDATGYAHPGYAASLSGAGEAKALPRSGGSILIRDVAGTGKRDAMGPYPIFSCPDWSGLSEDLEDLVGQLVSISAVADPFGPLSEAELRAAFIDLVVPFKKHHVVDLTEPPLRAVSAHHRRNLKRALAAVDVEVVTHPTSFLEDWLRLYAELTIKHRITGITAFSRSCFERQLRVPGMIALRAHSHGRVIGGTLWLINGSVAYYHLGAYNQRGYELRASFALFAAALEQFRNAGLEWASLGGGVGATSHESDGLVRFKEGWSTGTKTVYLCGRILSPPDYRRLAAERQTDYFPAYRAGEFA
jgi:hypothetical protein